MGRSRFTDEANVYLKENAFKYTSRELSSQLLDLFGIKVATQTVTDQINRLGIHRGKCFHPEGWVNDMVSKPIGYERVDKNRQVMVKVAQPNVWKSKASVLMGYDPEYSQAIFLDGNSLNVVPDNIVVVSKKVHAQLSKNGWLGSSREVLFTAIKLVELLYVLKDYK